MTLRRARRQAVQVAVPRLPEAVGGTTNGALTREVGTTISDSPRASDRVGPAFRPPGPGPGSKTLRWN